MFTSHSSLTSRRLGLSLIAGAAISAVAFACPAYAQATKPGKAAKAAEPSPYKTPATKDQNAALEYMTTRDLFDRAFLDLVGDEWKGSEPGWVPSEKLTVLLEENQPLIKRIMEASRLPNCDFGIRYEEGFACLLPHLGNLRTFARVFGCDARRLAIAGRSDEAAERLVTCLRMSRHLTQDKILISSLVSIAITSLAVNQAEITARDYSLTDSGRKQFIKAAKALLTDDPFATRACIMMEKQLALNSLKPWIQGKGKDAGRALVKQLKDWQIASEGLKEVESLNEEQLNEQIDLLERYYAALNNVWVAPDAVKRLKELEERLTAGDFGLLVRHLAPALTKAHMSTTKVVKEINDVIALLEASAEPAAPAETEDTETGG